MGFDNSRSTLVQARGRRAGGYALATQFKRHQAPHRAHQKATTKWTNAETQVQRGRRAIGSAVRVGCQHRLADAEDVVPSAASAN